MPKDIRTHSLKPKAGVLFSTNISQQNYENIEYYNIDWSASTLNHAVQSNICDLWLILPPNFDFIDSNCLAVLIEKLYDYHSVVLYTDYLLYFNNAIIPQYLPSLNDIIVHDNFALETPILMGNINAELFIEEKNIISGGLHRLYNKCSISHIPEFYFKLVST